MFFEGRTWARYRVVRDYYSGYETQIFRFWWPFWVQVGGTNTHSTAAKAEAFARQHAMNSKVVLWLGQLPTRFVKKPELSALSPNHSPPDALQIANEPSPVISKRVGENEFVQAISGVLSS
jgi:hypothetical protein